MPYNPTLPVDHSEIVAVELRNQFNGLNDLIDALPTSPDMTNAIAAISPSNVNAVSSLSLTVSDPPTQAEMQSVVDKLNELITALWR